jgi:hypothetical protein
MQKQDGKTRNLRSVFALLWVSRRFAPNAEKPTLRSFMLTSKEGEQTLTAKSATKTDAKSGGTREVGLIAGHPAHTSMVLHNNSLLICSTNKRENAHCVAMSQKLKEVCMSIIAMQLKKFEDFFVMDATLALGRSKKTLKFSQKQSVI